ncbi:actin interacting protein 3-domain-containing protein [Microdochium trichocladiopsis]|uniref:Actin interacting protein 3-domain-containing protein n=1 Tax=Microdochium trichocladiopsis TaxID=1682393 RepID=A0A9P8YHM9_9PEZI|nr:actin interacting protein 3-domain-containing protein [Microdochium trichocladiopsis]KAH7040686.1 actin interacting protein 3-domain-containing protein [Microdochium trichocladiopsis]
MQASNSVQRSIQRRSPGPDGPSNLPPRPMSPAGMQPRSSAASSRSLGSSRRNQSGGSNMPLSQIEKSVTHLLVATKQLLETLTQWSRGAATDTQVSDVYVRLGYEFNMACRAFTAINVDTSDLGNVPESLRHILESTLSQEASTESLEKYLPKIRDIIINLLHGLKRKQQRLRQKQSKDRDGAASPEAEGSGVGRSMSSSTVGSTNTGLTSLLNEGIDKGYGTAQRDSASSQAGPSGINSSPSRRGQPRDNSSSIDSTVMQNIPSLPPYPGDDNTIPSGPSNGSIDIDSFPPPPPPPKSQQSALAALQRGGDLERRASRRYSAYQISKHLGAPANGVPMLPTQNTPIPNRGRGEVRESMRAVQVREALKHNRNESNQSRNGFDPSPVRVPSKVSEESSAQSDLGQSRAQSPPAPSPDSYKPSATLSGPLDDAFPITASSAPGSPKKDPSRPRAPIPAVEPEQQQPPQQRVQTPPAKEGRPFALEQSPPLDKELTLFLQYKSRVKKFVLPEGYADLTLGRLQLAFIEKFSWNTALNGSDLPEIYIQDPVSGVRHELEDLSDIKDRTVLALNVEALDEVKKHFDDGLGSLKKAMDEVKQNVTDQGLALQRVSDQQLETSKEMARMAAAPAVVIDGGKSNGSGSSGKLNPSQLRELQTLRRDLAILRQTYSNFQTEVQSSMSTLRTKADNVKVAAAKASVPSADGDSGYGYVKNGRKQMNADSDRLVTKVDDLQDLVEDLRKDVVLRGVRPLPRQLDSVSKDISQLTTELKRMDDYMKKEKPIWTKIWEKELEDVCQGRDELRLMEDLMVDLQDDLEKASETFALVEQATKEQMKDSAPSSRQFSKGLSNLGNSSNPSAAKEGVLGEVRALQPNHEDRLEAIERAEKLRQKELAGRMTNPLKKELSNFVEEGKLKKSGGFEEVERARKAKDDRIRKEVWERMNGIIPDDPIGEEYVEGEEGAETVEGDADNDENGAVSPAPA